MNSTYKYLIVNEKNEIISIKLNRPDDRNSINTPLIEELEAVLLEAESGSNKCIIFSGNSDVFFAGGADAVEMINYEESQAFDFSRRIQALYDKIEKSPLITLAAINGLCYGGGMELALACDFRVAVESVRMGLPEVRVGIIPGGGGTQRLGDLIGTGRALEMILTGRLCHAEEALSMGLVHRVVPELKLFDESQKLLEYILRNPIHAIVHAKKAFYSREISETSERYRNESFEFGKCFNNEFFIKEIHSQIKSGQMTTTRKIKEEIS